MTCKGSLCEGAGRVSGLRERALPKPETSDAHTALSPTRFAGAPSQRGPFCVPARLHGRIWNPPLRCAGNFAPHVGAHSICARGNSRRCKLFRAGNASPYAVSSPAKHKQPKIPQLKISCGISYFSSNSRYRWGSQWQAAAMWVSRVSPGARVSSITSSAMRPSCKISALSRKCSTSSM